MLWLIFAVMLCAAIAAVLVPLYKGDGRFTWRIALSLLLVSGTAVLTYATVGSPDAQDVVAQAPGQPQSPEAIEAMVESLASRLNDNPDDLDGWKMLGRSYAVMGRFDDAVASYERAIGLENSENGQTLADLAEVLFMADNQNLNGRAGQLFESALTRSPGNPKALFYSGLAAAGRGDNGLAADRWEALLATSPPPEVEQALRGRIAALRGESNELAVPQPNNGSAAITVDVEVGSDVAGLSPDATVFVIARDPAQPTPPVAVARRKFNELPTQVTLTDADAMLPGRPLSGFSQVEIVVRASASGQPMAQPGDWFGTAVIDVTSAEPAAAATTIAIDQKVR